MSLPRGLLALAAGAASVFAFSPFDFPVAALAAFALLAHEWVRAESPRAAFGSGWWFGLGLFGAGVSWIYVSMHRYGGMPAPLAALATLIFCAFLALFPALAGWLQARCASALPPIARASLLIPALWTFIEWVRSWILTGFPWLSAGYAALDTPFAGYAPLGGVYLCSVVVVCASGLLWCALRGERRWAAVALLVALAAGGAALRAIEWTAPKGHVAAAVLQGNVPQELKFDPERYARTLATYEKLAEAGNARLVVMPETAIPRFLDDIEPGYLRRLEAIGRRAQGDVLFGAALRDGTGAYFNAAIAVGASPPQAYRKAHLVPFGEFAPPGTAWAVRMLGVPMSDFSRGAAAQRPLAIAGEKVAVNICYEDAFGEEIARQLPEATLLVNLSNVAWFGDSLAPAQHLQIARLRALETGRAYLTATNTGISAAIDRDGAVLARLPPFAEGRLDVSVPAYTGATPYVRIGDLGALAAIALMLAACLFIARRGAGR